MLVSISILVNIAKMHDLHNFPKWTYLKRKHTSGQSIIFHQPRFPWNKGIALTITTIWGKSVVWGRDFIWPDTSQIFSHLGAPPIQDESLKMQQTKSLSHPCPMVTKNRLDHPWWGKRILVSHGVKGVLFISGAWCFVCAWMNMGVSTNNGIPIWMVYNGNPY